MSVVALSSFVLAEPHFEDQYGGSEVVALRDQEVDVVEVLFAAETVGEVVARIDRGSQFAASGTEKAGQRKRK